MPDSSTGIRYVVEWQPLGLAEHHNVSLLLDPPLLTCAQGGEGIKGAQARLEIVKIFRETLMLTEPHTAMISTWFDHLRFKQV